MKSKQLLFTRKNLVVGVAAALSLSMSSAFASKDDVLNFDLSGRSVQKAIMTLSEKSGVQIVLSEEVMGDVRLKGLKGSFTLSGALDRVLSGTGLTYEFDSDDLVVIKQEGSAKQQAEDEDKEVEEVVVTGSRIRGANPTSPVTVIDRAEIEKRGFSSAADIVRSLPQNFNSLNESSTLLGGIGGIPMSSQGSSAANLRGLGSNATLVLVNGRRVAASPTFQDGTVNLSTIPFAAIERVEVNLDGASAIYGADAVGGVINFILRKGYTGATTSVRYENSIHGGDLRSLDQLFGTDWGSGSANIAMSFKKSDPVQASKVGYVSQDLTSIGGTDGRSNYRSQPGRLSADIFGIDWSMPIGSVSADDDGTVPLTYEDIFNGRLSDTPVFDNPARELSSATDNYSVSLRVDQEITDNLEVFFDGSYNLNKAHANKGYMGVSLDTWFAEWRGSGARDLPTTNAFNDTGMDLGVNYIFAQETEDGLMPMFSSDGTQKRITLNSGFSLDLTDDWRLKAEGGYSKSTNTWSTLTIDPDTQAYLDAVADSNPLTALNLIGNGTAQNAETVRSIIGRTQSAAPVSESKSWLISADGSLYTISGGDIRLGVGGEYRSEELDYSNDPLSASWVKVINPGKDIEALFAEASIPLVSQDNAMPGIQSLDLSIAARWERTKIKGPFGDLGASSERSYSQISPRFGLAWYPISELKIHASLGESYRAPVLGELLSTSPSDPFYDGVFDPLNPVDNGGPDTPVDVLINYDGNPDLKPEIAEVFSIGFEWNPTFLDGLTVQATYNNIEFENAIVNGIRRAIGDDIIMSNPDRFPGMIDRDTNGVIQQYNLMPLNLSRRTSKAIDFDIGYVFDSDWGEFDVGVGGTYISELSEQVFDGFPEKSTIGTDQGPQRIKLTASIGWSRESYGANIFAYHSGHYTNMISTGWFSDPIANKVEKHITTDLSGYYNLVDSDWKFSGGVRNLFNTKFPFAETLGGLPFDTKVYNTRGRVIWLEVKKSFDI